MDTKNKKAIKKITEIVVLQPYLGNYKESFHIRQIAHLLKMNHRTVSLALQRLETKNMVRFSIEGRNKRYFLNLDNPEIENYIVNAEDFKRAAFIEKYFLFKKMISELLLDIVLKGIPISIYGSYAKNEEDDDKSDIDILILHGKNSHEIKKKIEDFGNRHNKKFHINIMKQDIFEEGLRKNDNFIIEILKNHIILNNPYIFVNIFWRYFRDERKIK